MLTVTRGEFENFIRTFGRPARRDCLPDPSGPPTPEQAETLARACRQFGLELVGRHYREGRKNQLTALCPVRLSGASDLNREAIWVLHERLASSTIGQRPQPMIVDAYRNESGQHAAHVVRVEGHMVEGIGLGPWGARQPQITVVPMMLVVLRRHAG